MAIRIAFSFGVVSEDRKSAALAFCNHIKDSDDGWRHALQRLHTAGLSGPQEVKFFCLDILRHTLLTGRYNRMLEQDRAGLRNSLLLFVRDVVPRAVQEPMIKNVLCLVLTLLVQQDFPERWPSFFTDFASLLSQSPEILDVYFRMLSTIQQEIVEFDRSQTSEEAAKHNIFIKDTIREKCFPSILNTIQQVMQSLHASHPTLVVSALQVLKQYTSWVDITLVVSPQMLTPLCQLLFQEVYQVTAAECLLEILYKRMGPIKKLTLLKEIRVFPLLVEVLNACATASACFVKKVAAVVNCLGVQLVEILKALRALDFAPASAPPRLIADDWDSSTWPPNVNPADVFSEASAMLDHALQLSFHLLETRGATDFKVSDELHDFVSHYILLIKPDTEGKNELAPGPLANFQRILRIIVQQLAYPERYDLENKFEIEEEFDSYHKDLCKVLHHQLQMCPWAVVEVTLAQLQLLAQHGDNTPVSWARLEATLFLAYSCGHNLSGRIHTSITVEPYRSMLGYAFSVSLGRIPHSLLMLTYFQLCTRWAPYLEAHTQYFLPVILTCLDSRGLHHSSPSVRSAASHCFIRLLKELANKCKHLIIANFDAIATKIESVVTSTLTQGLSGI
jgi:exportin-T